MNITYEQLMAWYSLCPAKKFWTLQIKYGKEYKDSFKMTYETGGFGKGREKYYIETELFNRLVKDKS